MYLNPGAKSLPMKGAPGLVSLPGVSAYPVEAVEAGCLGPLGVVCGQRTSLDGGDVLNRVEAKAGEFADRPDLLALVLRP